MVPLVFRIVNESLLFGSVPQPQFKESIVTPLLKKKKVKKKNYRSVSNQPFSSDLRVFDSQTYKEMDVTRECIRFILDLREIFMSFQTGFNLINAAVVCAIPESI